MTARGPVTLVVTFGPSRSPVYTEAVRYGRRHGHRATEVSKGRWRIEWELDRVALDYAHAHQLVFLVSGWRSSMFEVDGEPERAFNVAAMLFSARNWLRSMGECLERFRG